MLSVWVYDKIEGDKTVTREFAKRPTVSTIKTIVAGVWKEFSNRGVPADLETNYSYYATVKALKVKKEQ